MHTTSTRPRWATRLIAGLGTVAVGSGLVLVAAGPASAAETATSGSLSWGVKASFRSYIASPIAHGSATAGGGASTAADGTFAFPAATGTVDGGSVDAAFGGDVHFTGHAGALDMTFSDLKLSLDGTAGQLFADVDSKGLSTGTLEHYEDVALATLDLGTVTAQPTAGGYSWTAIPATLTADGATAFAGFYSAGTALDPVSFSLDVAEDTDPGTDPGTPAEDEQELTVVVPEGTEEPQPGAFGWEITGDDSAVSLGTAAASDGHLSATGQLKPVVVTDTRSTRSAWSITAQVSDFTAGATTFDGSSLGWTPRVVTAGGGATAGAPVVPGLVSGPGLSQTATLGSATTGHELGTATLGADLELQVPADTAAGTYGATLTLTALS